MIQLVRQPAEMPFEINEIEGDACLIQLSRLNRDFHNVAVTM